MCCSRAYYVIMMPGTAHAAALMVTGNWRRGADTSAVSTISLLLPSSLACLLHCCNSVAHIDHSFDLISSLTPLGYQLQSHRANEATNALRTNNRKATGREGDREQAEEGTGRRRLWLLKISVKMSQLSLEATAIKIKLHSLRNNETKILLLVSGALPRLPVGKTFCLFGEAE